MGFIAQQVKLYFPEAVKIREDFIPNEMRELEDFSWEEEIIDSNSKTFKLTTDLIDCSGIKYRFVAEDIADNDKKK